MNKKLGFLIAGIAFIVASIAWLFFVEDGKVPLGSSLGVIGVAFIAIYSVKPKEKTK